MESASAATLPSVASPTARLYQVGALRYNLRALVVLFGWLLWGDFCFTIFQTLLEKFLPLFMKDLHASNTLIGVMTGSIAGILSIFVMPPVSMSSDRYRSRLGRRIPYLIWSTPCTVLLVGLMGWAPEIGGWLHAHVTARFLPFTETAVVLTTLCTFIILNHISNMVMINIFNGLLRDVVPGDVMGRFVSLFRIVGALGNFVFSWFIFQYVLIDRKLVCVGLGIAYMCFFLLMCWQVKEGEYDPPPPKDPADSQLRKYIRYYREFLSVSLYRNFLAAMILCVFATSCANPFMALFARDTLGLSMDSIGRIFAWGFLGGAVAFFPVGYLCDRIGAVPVMIYGFAGYAASMLYALLGVHSSAGWLVYSVLVTLPVVMLTLALTACMLELFEQEKFAQLCSCLVVLGWGGGSIIGNYAVGRVIDLSGGNYRVIFAWAAVASGLALIPMWRTWREWRRLGGPDHYVPPSIRST